MVWFVLPETKQKRGSNMRDIKKTDKIIENILFVLLVIYAIVYFIVMF